MLGQLGNRVQHALRAYTPKDRKAVRTAAQTFRPNPALDTEQIITEMGVGEALVSTLQPDGTYLRNSPSGNQNPRNVQNTLLERLGSPSTR